MIPKISRGSDPAGLVKYLFGKGRHNEHANQHLVACSDDLLDSFGFDGHPDESYAKIGAVTSSGNIMEEFLRIFSTPMSVPTRFMRRVMHF